MEQIRYFLIDFSTKTTPASGKVKTIHGKVVSCLKGRGIRNHNNAIFYCIPYSVRNNADIIQFNPYELLCAHKSCYEGLINMYILVQ